MASWANYRPPSDSDPDAFLFMGADPCWTPEREFKRTDSSDHAAGECLLCGGDRGLLMEIGGTSYVVSQVPPGSHRVCVRCGRSGSDQHSSGVRTGRMSVSPKSVPGYVSRDGVHIPERYSHMLNEG